MKLSKSAKKIITENLVLQAKIAELTKSTLRTIERWVEENKENSMLTTMAVLKLIREETGLNDEQILIENVSAK